MHAVAREFRATPQAIGKVVSDLWSVAGRSARRVAVAVRTAPAQGAAAQRLAPLNGERQAIADDLARLEGTMRQLEVRHRCDIEGVHPQHQADAVNLVHYLALRQGDVRSLQRRLGARGLSSLGRCEPHVLATVESVRAELDPSTARSVPASLSFEAGRSALDRNTDALFGPRPRGRVPRVMVTLPTEASTNYELVRHLVASGMDVARINGAHDGSREWEAMARNVRKASDEVARRCRISMDLPGPKLRTGPLVDGPRVVRVRPDRDLRGVPVAPGLLTMVGEPPTPGALAPAVPVDPDWLDRRRMGDNVDLVDTRGSRRRLKVVACRSRTVAAEVWDTTYLETGSELCCGKDRTLVGALPALPQYLLLRSGDRLRLTESLEPVPPWDHGQGGMARIGCTLPGVLGAAAAGQRVVLDDGKITGVVESAAPGELVVRIETAGPRGTKLRAEKGINLPDTDLREDPVTDADLAFLGVAAAHADMVALSFMRNEADVDSVRSYLHRVGADHVGLVLKIETEAAFVRLPTILLHAMRAPRVGVMIARGDLAVEVGYQRLAEMQEEILWLCEAAHLPVIWATEVLDNLARTGQPSRAEVTDAAMAQRAECVMLNKGPHVDTAIVVLDDILRRMSGHQRKKTALLRPLRSWEEPQA